MRVCKRVFSVGFVPGLDSMSPARSRRDPAAWLASQKNWVTGPPGRLDRWVQFVQSPRLWHANHVQAVSVWCNIVQSSIS